MFGQISSESSGTRHISGTGGQLDFVTGAYSSRGGKAIICCTSSYQDKHGNLQSRIVPMLPLGSIVSVPRTQAHIIITEYGKCDLRDELIREAQKMKIWSKSNKIPQFV